MHFSDFKLIATKESQPVFSILVAGNRTPIVFAKTGNYVAENGKQKNAFTAGTVYFRHGAKSEPGTTEDLRVVVEREIERVKESWLGGIRKVVEAPIGSQVLVVPDKSGSGPDDASDKIQIVRESSSVGTKEVLDPDAVYPYRQREVLTKFTERQPDKKITTHDLLCVRRLHNVDSEPHFSYKGKYGSRQYSIAFVEWLLEQHQQDGSFFEKAKETYKAGTIGLVEERILPISALKPGLQPDEGGSARNLAGMIQRRAHSIKRS